MENQINIELIILAVTLIVNFLLAFVVFKNNPKSATNVLFTSLSAVTILWLVINYISLKPLFIDYSLILSRLSIFFAVPQILLFLLLSHTLPKDKLKINNKITTILVLITLLIMMINISSFAFTGIEVINGSPSPIAGPGIIPFALYAVFFSTAAIYILFKRLKEVSGLEKEQIRYVMYGILAILSLLALTLLLPVALFKNVFFVQFSPLYTLIFLGMTTYAILRHRLLDIRLVVARTVSFAILIGLLSIFYVVVSIVVSDVVFGLDIDTRRITIFTVLTLVVAFSFAPFRRILEKITDKFFYKDKYDTPQLLYHSALTMASTLQLEELTHHLLKELINQMRISNGVFLLTEKGKIYDVILEGLEKLPVITEKDLTMMLSYNRMIIYEEVQDPTLKELLGNLKFKLIVPLHIKGENIGLLALGEKLSGDIYSSEDIRVLEILAPEASVAIQNAKAYEEIRRFNVTLQNEVNRATQELQIANTRLQELDQLKDDFVSIVSHELRTPMTAIRSYVWMALHKSDVPLTEKLKRYLYRTLVSTERLISLVNDMLNISRIEAGRIEIAPQAFDIVGLIKDVIEEVRLKADEKYIKIDLKQHFTPVPLVFGDPDKVHQVLLNLIGNALKFTPLQGTITIKFFTDGQMVETSVTDSGVGISKEDVSKLFHKFGRLDNSYEAMGTSGGTGLGLFISKKLMDLMKGTIKASSEGVGKGATFSFTLPVATKELIADAEKYHLKPQGEQKILEPVVV